MTAYLLVYGKDPTDRFAVYAYPNREAARRASMSSLVPKVPPDGNAGGCGYVIENAEDVSFGAQLIIAVYNAVVRSSPHVGHEVQRFESRAVGARRLLALLQGAVTSPSTSTPAAKENPMPTTTETTSRAGRKPRYQEDQVIEVLVDKNPFKPGKKNHDRFAALMRMRGTITVKKATEAGVPFGDLAYEVEKGYIAIREAAAAAA